MLKSLSFIFMTLLTLNSFSQGDNFEMRFWDSTFAYNQLIVKSNPHQSNIAEFELSGSQINLGTQIEGLLPTWSHRDLMQFSLRKSDCSVLDRENKQVVCQAQKVYVRNLTWQVNQRLTKTYNGLIEDLNVSADKNLVRVSFKIPADEDFTPHQDEVVVTISLNSF